MIKMNKLLNFLTFVIGGSLGIILIIGAFLFLTPSYRLSLVLLILGIFLLAGVYFSTKDI